MSWLTIAMPKGRIFEEAVQMLRLAGFQLPSDFEDSRKLIIDGEEEKFRFILAKPMDVPTYVEQGVADIGIAGKDVLLEEQRNVYELLDLQISPCYLAVAGLPSQAVNEKVATKYPHIASSYFRKKGEQVDIIPLRGSIELAPLVGLADRIVDIVSTGRTLKENGLVEYDRIIEVTSRLIANPVQFRLKYDQIQYIVQKLTPITKKIGAVSR
ncbi:ATP phosphoribosyltransferase [Aeribacillus pallidus]|uniref:ATP phosphoribosyltransferase n=1 Tax=Aeribacillus pallidus TaxID=33936 RepID=UPI003D1F0CDF